ncbi:hypothetical protein HPB47_013904, partial [Ixodes persulcatus]
MGTKDTLLHGIGMRGTSTEDDLDEDEVWRLCVRPPVEVDKRVAIALYKLASCCEYRVVANQFGVHKSTVKKYVYLLCQTLTTKFMMDFIRLPNVEEARQIAANFEGRCHIPQIWGAIDGTHIPILAPRKGYRDFVNRKHWPSFNMQAVVDDRGVFRSISCSVPGSAHDATVLKLSGLYRHSDRLLPTDDCVVNGRPIPLMLVGDPAYPLLPWILKGYVATKNGISQKDDSFNTYLSSARIVVEQAFGRMKGRWRIVLKRADIDYKFVPTMAAAVCVLHNFCELHSERYNIGWNADVAEYEKIFPQPVSSPRDVDAEYPIRDFLRDYLGDNFPLRSSSY